MSIQISYTKQGIFGVMFLIIIFIAIEGIMQIIWHDMQVYCSYLSDPYFKSVPLEKVKKMCSDEESIKYTNDVIRKFTPNQNSDTMNINSLGFRGYEFSPSKPKDEYRIFMVGGSTTFGLGATSDSTTIPAYLDEMFKKNHPEKNINVINAGIIAARSADESYLIKNDLINYEPDLIIVFDGYNDAFNIMINEHEKTNKDYKFRENETDLDGFIKKYLKWLATPNVIYQWTHDYLQNNYLTDEVKEKNTDAWVTRWNNICELGKESDFNLIVMIQPMIGTSKRELSPFEQKSYEHFKLQKQLKFLNALGDSANKINCPSIDLRDTFDGINQQVFISNVHTSDFGNKILASKIYERINPIIFE